MSLYAYHQRFEDLRWAGFSVQMFIRRTALSVTTKLSAEHETPPIANVLLVAVVFLSFLILIPFFNYVKCFMTLNNI